IAIVPTITANLERISGGVSTIRARLTSRKPRASTTILVDDEPCSLPMATILELWRYPVKSLGGERIERAAVAPKITGDREWGIFDAATRKLLSARSVATLLMASATWRDGVTTIQLPSGTTVTAGDPAASAALSDLLQRAVVLREAAATEISTIDTELDDGLTDSFLTQPGSLYDSRSTLHL